jgi:hypothetical protein
VVAFGQCRAGATGLATPLIASVLRTLNELEDGAMKLLLAAVLLSPGFVESSDQPLTVEAHVSTAGPYGEMWDLVLPPEGEVSLEIVYMLNPMGEMRGQFVVSAEQRAAVRSAVEAQDFFGLAEEFWPERAPIHAPNLVLTVRLGERSHEVRIYSPEAFREDPQAQRFFEIWKQVFSVVPLKPKW